jgi:SDR family mycofactocin-dependent oxidoreductase
VQDKVVLVTGAARGQGRSHAVKLAEEGADIILFDICRDIEDNTYPLSTAHDLDEAGREVEKTGRRAIISVVDVRDKDAVWQAVDSAVEEMGHLEVVVANACICPLGASLPISAFATAFEVDFIGVVNTVHATLRHLKGGASVITVGSIAGLLADKATDEALAAQGPGGAGYNLAKQFVDGYTLALARQLAPLSIRANVVHPTNCDTSMLHNEALYKIFRPDLDHPTRDDAMMVFPLMHTMPTPFVEPADTSNAVCFLASDESRFITGLRMTVDAGLCLKA